MTKEKPKKKWDWKEFWIAILVLIIFFGYLSYNGLSNDYQNYRQNVLLNLSELRANLTETMSNYDCYPRGTIPGNITNIIANLSNYDCYQKGQAYCYTAPQPASLCPNGFRYSCNP